MSSEGLAAMSARATLWIVMLGSLSISSCFGNANIVCEAGSFLDDNACELCRNCADGEYIASACAATTNTQCASCKTSCATNEYPVSPCTGESDLVCGICHDT